MVLLTSSSALLTLIALVASIDGGQATVEGEWVRYLRPADVGLVQYEITVGEAARTIEVGRATVLSVGDGDAEVELTSDREVRPGFLVRFEVPFDRAGINDERTAEREAALLQAEADLAATIVDNQALASRITVLESGREPSVRDELLAELERRVAPEGSTVQSGAPNLQRTQDDGQLAGELTVTVEAPPSPPADDIRTERSPGAGLETRLAAALEEAQLLRGELEAERAGAASRIADLERTLTAKEAERQTLVTELDKAHALGEGLEATNAELPQLRDELAAEREERTELAQTLESTRVELAAARNASAEPAPPPVETSEPAPAPDLPTASQLEARVGAWAAAWSGQDVPAYLAFYAVEFQPPGGVRRQDWEATRGQRLRAPEFVEVELDAFEMTWATSERAEVRFEQSYRSDSFQDQVTKTLTLVLEGGAWKIASEASG